MLFARSVAVACLTVMKALCWFTGALLLLLTLVQYVRGDVDARPDVTTMTGSVFVVVGIACGWFSRRFQVSIK